MEVVGVYLPGENLANVACNVACQLKSLDEGGYTPEYRAPIFGDRPVQPVVIKSPSGIFLHNCIILWEDVKRGNRQQIAQGVLVVLQVLSANRSLPPAPR